MINFRLHLMANFFSFYLESLRLLESSTKYERLIMHDMELDVRLFLVKRS